MTISSTTRKAGPFTGNDVTTAFPFAFKVFSASDVVVVRTDLSGAETTLTISSNYTVTINANQDTNPGGTVTLLAALTSGFLLTLTSGVQALQPTDLTNQGGFYPKVINAALDRLTILVQQLAEAVSRSVKTAISTPPGVNSTLPAPVPYQLIGWNADGTGFQNTDPTYSTALATDLANSASGKGAALVGYGGETVYPSGTVGSKLREHRSLQDFWHSGDGTDYTPALQRAMDSGEPVISGLGRDYTVGGSVTGRGNLRLENITLNAPGLSSNAYILNFSGADGTPQALAADVAESAFSCQPGSTSGFAVDGWAWIASSAYWSPASDDNVTMGEAVRIAAISGGLLYFYTGTACAYTVADAATITPISTIDDIIFDNVQMAGPVSSGNQSGVKFDRCFGVELRNVRTTDFDYSHVVFNRSFGARVWGGRANKTGAQEGLDYGIVVSQGCFDVAVDGYTGSAMRHIITIGGSAGVSRHVSAVNCRAFNMTDAGMDSHSAAIEVNYSHNFISHSNDADSEMDGISAQCAQLTAIGNQIHNCRRHGIDWTPGINAAAFGGVVSLNSSANKFWHVQPKVGSGTAGAITASTANYAGAVAVTVVSSIGDQSSGFDDHVLVQANSSPIRKVNVIGGSTPKPCLIRGVHIYAKNSDIEQVAINGGAYEVSSGNEIIYLQGNAGVAKVKNWAVGGCSLIGTGANTGLRLLETDNGVESGLTTKNCSNQIIVDANSTAYQLKTGAVGKTAWAGATLADGTSAVVLVTVPGAAYGDIATCAVGAALQDATVSANVTGSNTVKVVIQNESGTSRTYAACDVTAAITKVKP
ncbi:MAG: hypothetical protein PHQ05_07550 [Sterolibacterium sp.]|nr:hypothetical protein [Sterolibacterium sp.]